MLSDYSSLIEVITATYFTMCIDDVLKSIWTPKYKEKITELLEGLKVPIVKSMRKDLDGHIDSFTAKIKNQLKVKSAFMLIVCVIYLYFVGLESHLQWFRDTNNEVELLTRISLLILITLLLGKYSFKNFQRIFWNFFLISVVLFVLYIHEISITSYLNITENRALCFTLIVLILPIVWQIYQCWAYSRLYYGFLRHNTAREISLYERARIALNRKDISISPVEYQDSVINTWSSYEINSSEDTQVNILIQKFVDRMNVICRLPSSYRLVWSNIIHHINNLNSYSEGDDSSVFKTTSEYVAQKTLGTIPKLNEHTSINEAKQQKEEYENHRNTLGTEQNESQERHCNKKN